MLVAALHGCASAECPTPSESIAHQIASRCFSNSYCEPANLADGYNIHHIVSNKTKEYCLQNLMISRTVKTSTGTNYYYACVMDSIIGEFHVFIPDEHHAEKLLEVWRLCYVASYAFYESEQDLSRGHFEPIDIFW